MEEKLYRIEQPKFPTNWEAEAKKLTEAQKRDLIDVSENPMYLYWDRIKYNTKFSKIFRYRMRLFWPLLLPTVRKTIVPYKPKAKNMSFIDICHFSQQMQIRLSLLL